MNAAIIRRGLATGWKGLLIAAAAVSAMLVLGLAVYSRIDLGVYDTLPPAVRSLMGIPAHADPAILAYSEMLASVGALAFVGVAISIGAQTVAGEEQARTLSLMLAAPISRVGYVASRALAVAGLLAAGGAVLWGVAAIAPRALGTAVGDAHVAALIVHLTATAIFHAALALAVGAATGRKGLAAGVATAVMVLGWVGSSLLPLWRQGAADWIPWHWNNGSTPLVNGIDARDLALLLGGAAALVAAGALGFRARELRLTQLAPGLVSRLRAAPMLARVLAPTGRGSSLLGIRIASQQVLLGYVAFIMLLFGLLIPLLYRPLSSALGTLAASFPTTLAALFGGGDLGTPAGFLHLEVFGLMAPAAVIVVGVAAASAGIAGEEQQRRMSLLLAQPVSRARTYWTVAAASVFSVTIVGAALFAGTWIGVVVSGLDISIAHLAAACALLILLGWWFAALALCCSAATGRTSLAVWVPTGVALATYFGYTLLLAAGNETFGWWSPFSPYLAGPPLAVGLTGWWQPVWLAVGTALLAGLGVPLFRRRDLRIGG